MPVRKRLLKKNPNMKPHQPFIASVLTLCLQAASAAGFADCAEYFPGPPPRIVAPGKQRELCFDGFAVLHSGASKTPVYAVERLSRDRIERARSEQRTDVFYPEARLPSNERATLDDYRGSSFDRGHMAPAADMDTPQAMAQSFSLANMVPQNSFNNRKPWAQIEKSTRLYALRAPGDVFAFTGPLFDAPVSTVGAGRVWVPSRLFKLVYTPASHRAWGYVQANDASFQYLRPLPYSDFVTATGLDLLKGLPIHD